MYSFNNRLSKLITFDTIRICKLFEIFQYSLISLALIVLFSLLLDKFYFKFISKPDIFDNSKDKNIKDKSLLNLFLQVVIDTFVIVVILFYLRKIGLLFPSIPSLVVPSFREHTTLDISIEVALIFVFLEFIPKYKLRIDMLRKKILIY